MPRLLPAILFVVLIIPAPAMAGSFQVTPVKLFFDAGTRTEVVRLKNTGDEKVTVQLDVKEWNQNEKGEDRYEETEDIIFFPRMVGIEKGEEVLIRVGYESQPQAAMEKTYRLYLEELPVRKPGEIGLIFALKIDIPIFIKPAKMTRGMSIEEAALSAGKLKVMVKNKGNSHLIVRKIGATGFNSAGKKVFFREMGGWYILGGVTKTYSMDIPQEGCREAATMKIVVDADEVVREAGLDVNSLKCRGPEKN